MEEEVRLEREVGKRLQTIFNVKLNILIRPSKDIKKKKKKKKQKPKSNPLPKTKNPERVGDYGGRSVFKVPGIRTIILSLSGPTSSLSKLEKLRL